MVLEKPVGVVLMMAGMFFIIFFPDIEHYQPRGYTLTGILVGLFLMVFGMKLVFG